MKRLTCLITALALWLVLFWSLDWVVLVVGAAVAVLASLFLAEVYPDRLGKLLEPRRWVWFLIYLPYFLWQCLKANVDVALRVIHPDVPIKPGIVKVRTSLSSEMAKTFLANSITLTPGTLTVDIDGQDLYIHWICIPTDDPDARTAEICGRFEPMLRRIFE